VFQFFTAKEVYRFDGHITSVKSMSWIDDDTGLASAAVDHKINFWKLSHDDSVNRDHTILDKNGVIFLSMALFKVEAEKGYKMVIFASGNNGSIYVVDGKSPKLVYEAGANFSQIVVLKGQRAIIGGSSDQNKPGNIQVITYNRESENKLEHSHDLHLHNLSVTKLILTYDNKYLFSGSEDGSFAFVEVLDKDTRKREPLT
jgi:WD40 repeat protein